MRPPSLAQAWIGLTVICLTGGLLSGCWKPTTETQDVLEPPLIPAPPSAVEKNANLGDALTSDILAYADQLELENTNLYPPGLAEAVSRAINVKVLKPTSVQDRFEPGRTITYGEFRQWALAYQMALYGYQALPSQEALAEINGNLETPKPDLAGPMSPEKLFILPETLEMGAHSLASNQQLSREALCHLYFTLIRQEDKLRKLSDEDIQNAFPPTPGSGLEESLSQFKDYPMIAAAARPAVAQFYREGLLQRLFRRTAMQLTIDEGFGPQTPVSRAEAIVLLHWAYGKIIPNAPKPQTKETKPAGERSCLHLPGEQSEKKASQPKLPPSPVGRWKLLEEKGPQGSRQAWEVSAP